MVVALLVLAFGLTAQADADTRSRIPGRAAELKRKLVRAAPVSRDVVRAAARDAKLEPNIPRTGLPEITGSEERLFTRLSKIANGRILRGSKTAVYVVDAHTGEEIYAVREDEPLNPASNVKLIATASALDVLGPDWRYETRLYGPSVDADGVAHGDVFLRGNYDPTLGVTHLKRLAKKLAESGLRVIDGDVLIGPGPTRDSVGRAKLRIRVRGEELGEPPSVEIVPETGAVTVNVDVDTVGRGRSRMRVRARQGTDELGHPRIEVGIEGRVRKGSTRTYWRTLPDRALFTAFALREALIETGIEVRGTARQRTFTDYVRLAGPNYVPVTLSTHRSAPMARIVQRVNKKSRNWLCDRVLMTAGQAAYGGEPSMEKGVRLMRYWLEQQPQIDTDDVVLDTGSGLSYNSELSARKIVEVLRHAAGLRGTRETDAPNDNRMAVAFRDSLSIAGQDGTLRRRFRRSDVRGKVIGKTGTLIRVIALSGILELEDGRAAAFSIVTNDHRKSRYAVRKEHEEIVEELYDYLRTK